MEFKVVELDSLNDTIFWTYRSWAAGYPVPSYAWDEWQYGDPLDGENASRLFGVISRAWDFLCPFFASRGYVLYKATSSRRTVTLPDPDGPPHPAPSHPFARLQNWSSRLSCVRSHLECTLLEMHKEGRLVSGRDEPTDELLILQKLNTATARADPRNHTIPVIEFITFDDLVFVVMPRWPPAFIHDFGTTIELMQMTEHILEVSFDAIFLIRVLSHISKAFEFLHENRIAHSDFLPQNCGSNVLADVRAYYLPNLRKPGEIRYALYDFGASYLLPSDTDVNTAMIMPIYLNEEPGKHQHPLFNPFRHDIRRIGGVMGSYVRVLEKEIPAIGPFFDSLMSEDPTKQPSASQALLEFRKISSSLTTEQLNAEVTGRYWNEDGNIITKLERPIELPDPGAYW
ncbi:hypothetical protein H0H92_005397 [Tricholoma furcatifolium]|nr:hypothetical protein H0H92_005397 [Tricholoma furcatifolium]